MREFDFGLWNGFAKVRCFYKGFMHFQGYETKFSGDGVPNELSDPLAGSLSTSYNGLLTLCPQLSLEREQTSSHGPKQEHRNANRSKQVSRTSQQSVRHACGEALQPVQFDGLGI